MTTPAPEFEWQTFGVLFEPVPYAAPGWTYLAATETDPTNHAAPGEDVSSWATGPAPFGTVPSAVGVGSGSLGWPAPATATPTSVRLWLRRTIAATPGAALQIKVRYDGAAAVYWNGALVTDLAETASLSNTATVNVTADPSGTNTLAVRVTDDAGDPPADYTYADVSVVAL